MCVCVCACSFACVRLSSTAMEPLPGVVLMDNNDVTQPDTWQKVLEVLRGYQADVVMRWVRDGNSLLIT